jgi:hypothetical protein
VYKSSAAATERMERISQAVYLSCGTRVSYVQT